MNRFAISVAGLGTLAAVVIATVLLTSPPGGVAAPGVSESPGGSATPSTTAVSSQEPSAAPSVKLLAGLGYSGPGTIAFTWHDPASQNDTVRLVNPNGSEQIGFGPPAPWDGGPDFTGGGCCAVFSPDGRRVAVAYEIQDPDGAGTLMRTWIISVNGTPISSVPFFCGGCASIRGLNYVPHAWSPDGKLLALETWKGNHAAGMAIAPVDASDWASSVSGAPEDIPIAFSPDSTRLLFVRMIDDERGTLMELTVPDVSDATGQPIYGATRELGTPGMVTMMNGYFGAPASWSPDGQQIAFAATDPSSVTSSMRIWVVGADGGDPVALTEARSLYTGAAWSPDGEWIAFDYGDFGPHDLFVVRPDGSDERNVTESFSPGICCARWSPDSTALLASGTVSADTESYLFIVPVDGSPVRQVTTVPGEYLDFSWGAASR